MIARRLAAVGALTLAALSAPALAQAAPIVPSQAILAAHEFPFGSTRYKVTSEVGSPAKSSGETACDRASYAVDKRMEGTRTTDASAERGATELEASVNERPMADAMRTVFQTCGTQFGIRDRIALLPLPADLNRYNGFVFISVARDSYIGVVDVRGAAVGVSVNSRGDQPADGDAFWQTLRAQVAKVERQP
ncbi:putative protein OS=Tsukamurella paurometabola (strain ATCC 8368 / DSM / CCUG 35730 /CIP 100753 / JCM 10117 / KCTC 9821 / NBRC 16120 / NCIMB 702349/ NCTC 13040) OX=521096 GN=Tpau_1767 PE=4 SV=1 [Tsukamurella paurometabola]|uniref:Uncharacterized protein n=1 Tax=Tsukamurella paurometabola (strain ATCC 8368 / DSM 20162 / CCUG 35730 / CIP 100753 / JCM 10117 / KCTC 9821 / NBRC 16120 / NCIMB 702349 / NCTC 13040) TaxID=521096 RepID=D5UMA5_TSUPD|nr:hypothetical protein [Tsukamurella paurometabola]ADG78385.1 hypothetical protein Tpau_1767 [Tsukamurella paurometabola DSM 20162]SUP31437.1 Uncharacterised protein [Tsukamurella paurometabola]